MILDARTNSAIQMSVVLHIEAIKFNPNKKNGVIATNCLGIILAE